MTAGEESLRQRRLDRMAALARDWDAGDLEALMAHVTDDCVYGASVGAEPGATFVGRAAVRQGFARLLAVDAGTKSSLEESFVCGDRGISAWRCVSGEGPATRVAVRGCDIFTFRGDLICRKEAYRKVLG